MLTISSRLPDIGTTIFDVMTKMANEQGAINLSQGFPDFDIDPELVSLVHEFMAKGHNQYASMPGVAALRLRGRWAGMPWSIPSALMSSSTSGQ